MSLLWKRAVEQPDFVSHEELANMYSGDYDVPMHKARGELRQDWKETHADPERDPADYLHSKDIEHGGPDQYISHLKKDIAANGMKEPLTIRGGNVVYDGLHRGLAAMDLKMDKIPVRHIR